MGLLTTLAHTESKMSTTFILFMSSGLGHFILFMSSGLGHFILFMSSGLGMCDRLNFHICNDRLNSQW